MCSMSERGTVVRGTWAHVVALRDNLRAADLQEVWASSHKTGPEALESSFHRSDACWAIERSGTCIAMYGVGRGDSMAGVVGSPWLLGSEAIRSVRVAFAKHCPEYLNRMLMLYPVLFNYVDYRNDLAIKWLKWCGFKFHPAVLHGPDQTPFYPFELRREIHV